MEVSAQNLEKPSRVKLYLAYFTVIVKLPFKLAPHLLASMRYIFKTAFYSLWSEPAKTRKLKAATMQFEQTMERLKRERYGPEKRTSVRRKSEHKRKKKKTF